MKKTITTFLCLILTIACLESKAARAGATKDRIDIPFTFTNGFIIVKMIINNQFPLKFIFDTGAEHTIITQREYTDLLNIDYHRRFRIKGADLDAELYALVARNINFKVEDFKIKQQRIFVLEEDYFRFQDYSGIDIQGILGAHIFKDFLIKIDYKKSIISLLKKEYFESRQKKYSMLDIEVEKGKPYVNTQTLVNDSTTINTRLLVDTGASIALLLYTDTHPDIQLPENHIEGNLGMGLGGYVKGFLGRIPRQELGKFEFKNVICNFQELPKMEDSSYIVNRNGIIGNILLSRFTVVFDLNGEKLYLHPGKSYKKAFEYDKSGLTVFATGQDLNVYYINDVRENSPAEEADIRIGDVILRANFWSTSAITLNELNEMFQRKAGKTMRLKILRNGEVLKKRFQLRKLL